LRVLFLVDAGVHEPSARVRAYQLVPGLSRLGVEARVLSASDRAGLRGKHLVLCEARRADVVVLQRLLPPRPLLSALTSVNRALVFDFDDALYTVPSRRRRLRAALASAVEVVAGSDEIARHARTVAGSVTVIGPPFASSSGEATRSTSG
jgi:hypothetical protein